MSKHTASRPSTVVVKREQLTATLLLILFIASPSAAGAAALPAGLYLNASGAKVYVGTEHELPDPAYPQYLDARSGTTGAMPSDRHLVSVCAVQEERRVVRSPLGVLGVSLYVRDTAPRSTVLLIHGSDTETREMGWIVPYFACNGVNVISYDQRGTGESTGDWLMNGPPQRAVDADAIYDAYRNDPHVDPRKIGVWGFSNGGWAAPIVAVDRPLAFMILQSAPASSVAQNVIFEAKETMRGAKHSPTDIDAAADTWQIMLDAIEGRTPVAVAKRADAKAAKASWFADSLLPLVPEKTALIEPHLSGWRRFLSYDPADTLIKVRTPTLAMYGGRDTKVDVRHDVPAIEAAFRHAGMRDLMVHWFADAGHTMRVTSNGFDNAKPVRYSRGYPTIMLDWLSERGFATTIAP
jgi:pimeloyl-ACP methyl ester carboxylesterase